MRAACDMFCIAPVEALLTLELMSIPEANTSCIAYGRDSFNMAFEFCGNFKEGIYKGRTKISPPLLNCTKESLQLNIQDIKGMHALIIWSWQIKFLDWKKTSLP